MNSIQQKLKDGKRKIAILIDPEKMHSEVRLVPLLKKINLLKPDFIFVGGSTVTAQEINTCIAIIKALTTIPVVIFPGAQTQVCPNADAILFLSLISGRNPDYLIGHQVKSAHLIKEMKLTPIPTGYILIDGEKNSSVAYVSQTTPIPNDQISIAVKTAIAGQMLGLSTIFMDAGSGAKRAINAEMIAAVKSNITIPLIIGGGIRTIDGVDAAFEAGADVVVIGNKVEEDMDFLLDLKNCLYQK
ncbi:geranylgeranylglyceryl/heptaprenylglyceryl phosphate synthase [Putridiphycobacter roseus]|uniref:Geranylgeranylglyceryl phosphate synthase n=1 Tax=Putridiphycobacter roseus TaxID=2219161 RepID=A0A2W1NBF7_9FLAO|nr:geranylgeranylglyceryl/heptaprenylglyceryl phosphate synthase [Putridiphycobacter roseus]PZE16645.1 geranylgeranylglyceryl/heptaprenylglyceryl phosphate synthase [Putridiphycobacter roseus]